MTPGGFDQLYRHIKRGRFEPVQDYVDAGGDPNITEGWSLLMVAAHFGQVKILDVSSGSRRRSRGADV